MTVLDIQRRLHALGFDPGPLDGAWGPRTRAGVVAFQRRSALAPDGVAGPKTRAALSASDPSTAPASSGEPIWIQEGRRRLGLLETDPTLKTFLKSDGRTLGDPSRLPWCGDFVETCLRLALPDEILPANPYLARNWLAFGSARETPAPGDVAVFWRGSRNGNSGHVGFVVGGDATALAILGGNQSNRVSVARLSRARLLGLRWPTTAGPRPEPRLGAVAAALSTNES